MILLEHRFCFAIAYFSAVISLADTIDWCSLDCVSFSGQATKNTMCTYRHQTQGQGSSGFCRNIRDSNTNDKRRHILHLHNAYRNSVAAGQKNGWPSAANMRRMSWDTTLEEVALRWAVQCQAGHDRCRRTPEFKSVGQNYAMLATSQSSPDSSNQSFKGWVDEISLATPSIVDSFQGGNWGHFTQVIWAESYKVGCAQIQFTEDEGGRTWYKTVLICDYGPAGNMVTGRVYQKGAPCSNCPIGSQCISGSAYPKLCWVPGDEKGGVGRREPGSGSGGNACLDPSLMVFTLFMAK